MSLSRATNRLTPNNIFDFAFDKLMTASRDFAATRNVAIIDVLGDSRIYGARVSVNENSIVLLSGARDDEVQTHNSIGTNSLPDVLGKVRSLQAQNPNETYLIPLAECQTVFGFFPRQHWTVLVIQNNDSYFFDPCSDSYSQSGLYSLEPLKVSLTKANFTLAPQNIFYLGWQQDSDSCGRFCSDIMGKIAERFFSGNHISYITDYLINTDNVPTAEKLMDEYADCVTDALIASNEAISQARGQGFLISPLEKKYITGTENISLNLAKQKDFFEKGAGGLKQFFLDFGRNTFSLKKISYDNAEHSENNIVNLLAEKSGWPIETLNQIVAANSQGPYAFLPFSLNFGIKDSSLDRHTAIKPSAPGDLNINIIRTKNNIIQLICQYQKFPIHSTKGGIVGYLPGPVAVTYDLKEREGNWGWQLKNVKTDNYDILRILSGLMLPEKYLLMKYCTAKPSCSVSMIDAPVIRDDYDAVARDTKETVATPPISTPIVIDTFQRDNLISGVIHEILEQTIKAVGRSLAQPNLQKLFTEAEIEVASPPSVGQIVVAEALFTIQQEEQKEADEDNLLPSSALTIYEDNDGNEDTSANTPVIIPTTPLANLIKANEFIAITPMKPKQSVTPYIAGALVAGGVSATSGLITFGVASFTILATIPLIGWSVITALSLALAILMTVKSIMNSIANNRPAIQPTNSHIFCDTQTKPQKLVLYSPIKSPLANHGLLNLSTDQIKDPQPPANRAKFIL